MKLKQAIIGRTDLGIGKGKIALVQVKYSKDIECCVKIDIQFLSPSSGKSPTKTAAQKISVQKNRDLYVHS